MELLVFLKTTVVRDADDAKAMTEEVHKRTPLINDIDKAPEAKPNSKKK